jgi:nicotinamidase-related amidase
MALPQSLEPISNPVHLSIDMQNIFARGGIWETPRMERVLPTIVALAELNPPQSIFRAD